MKLLQVFNQYRFHGGEEAWVGSISKLLGVSATVEDLTFRSDDWIGENAPKKLKQIRLIGDNPMSRAALREHVLRFKPDALIFHNTIPVGSFGLYDEARSLELPVIQYTHNFRPFSPGGTLWLNDHVNDAALRGNPWPEIYRGAWQGSRLKTAVLAYHLHQARAKGSFDCIDHWLAISNFMRDKFAEAGIPRKKITVLRHCWEAEPFISNIEESDHYLFLGRLVREKGPLSLLDAWKILENKLGNRCPRLILAGDGPLEAQIRLRVDKMHKVECVGFVSGIKKTNLIRSCRALMVPSIWWEPLGLTTYEAYASARPVIAARSGALKETVFDEITGWHHEPDDAGSIANAVTKAELTGETGRTKYGLEGRKWLIEEADPNVWKSRFISTVEKVVEAKRKRS
ncbi:glycosyltransferase family 4 protein [Luteolibacter sp. AS25]|uniref:glycosyltransferase family 4 protein n=1 Tax=Luteolibacter sp. AS25 TaxID=3135776 RepID=UPI00398B264B